MQNLIDIDHSYSQPWWTSLADDEIVASTSVLLTDHSYAAIPCRPYTPIGLSSVVPTDVNSLPCPDEPNLDVSFPTYPILTDPTDPSILDHLITQIDLHIDPDKFEQLQTRISGLTRDQPIDNCLLRGPPSKMFNLLTQLCHSDSRPVELGHEILCLIEPVRLDSKDANCKSSGHHTNRVANKPERLRSKKSSSNRPFGRRRLSGRLVRSVRPTEMFLCPNCGNQFTRAFALKEHIEMIHHRNPRHRCTYCGHGFKRPALLRDHICSKHLKTSRFVCPICFKGFVRRSDFRKHVLYHQPNL